MSNPSQFTAARADRQPKGYSKALRDARTECPECWVVGGHDPRCTRVARRATNRANAANARAAKESP